MTRKEQQKNKLQEKIITRAYSQQKQQFKNIVGWSFGLLLIVGVAYGLSRIPPKTELPQLGESFAIQGQEHIAVGATHSAFNSNPPTSGWHYAEPAKWGVQKEELPDEQLVHNLEHGGIWISYSKIDDTTRVALEKITDAHSKTILTPRAKDDAPIVLASWGHLQKLQSYDETTILNFIAANSNKSPEPFAE